MIYLEPVGGLCNRMRAIDSLLSLCVEYNQDITIIWNNDKELNCPYKKLFAPLTSDKIKISFITKNLWYRIVNMGFNFMNRHLLSKSRIEEHISNSYFDSIYNSNDSIPFPERQKNAYSRIPLLMAPMLKSKKNFYFTSCFRFCEVKEDSYNWVKPVAGITQRVTEKTKEFKNTVGFHIRRTDHYYSKTVSTDEKVFTLIHTLLSHRPDTTFFIASDCEATKEKLKKTFGNTILTNSIKSYDRVSNLGIRYSLIDLLCLSKTKKIYGSYRSSFSQVAADIGRVELEIIQ